MNITPVGPQLVVLIVVSCLEQCNALGLSREDYVAELGRRLKARGVTDNPEDLLRALETL